MPIYSLPTAPVFPDPELAEPNGVLAVGGDLGMERLVAAYSKGIFPWLGHRGRILWWSPPERAVFFQNGERLRRRSIRAIRRIPFEMTMDTCFEQVIRHCALVPREGQRGTWITAQMETAYIELHRAGLAHSVETWLEGRLVGGLYGVSLGAAFFGESMFSLVDYASRAAFKALCTSLWAWGFHFIDGQLPNDNLDSLGAVTIPRSEFLARLEKALEEPTKKGRWRIPVDS
ncbi:MAG: leucyl/phenylalanyl-tRNA--protein transferase [Holophagales bacterium]|jgi:leucyl/phenylalanyl-tRNA--protein transferase|nr:leucyl/phenylalanyl-tRNA--protein transferase [Holophagales bacterium]